MKITTKYNSGDKIWFYIEEINQCVWGKIESLDVSVRIGIPDISYHIKNRFYKDNDVYFYGERTWKNQSILTFQEDEVFNSSKEVMIWLNKKHKEKMGQLKELKKGF